MVGGDWERRPQTADISGVSLLLSHLSQMKARVRFFSPGIGKRLSSRAFLAGLMKLLRQTKFLKAESGKSDLGLNE